MGSEDTPLKGKGVSNIIDCLTPCPASRAPSWLLPGLRRR